MVPRRRFPGAVLLCAVSVLCGRAQTQVQHGPIQKHIPIQAQQVALVTVSCSAEPVRVFTGGIATIQAEGRSFQGLALRYSFTTDAGQISMSSSSAVRLNTAGLGARAVHVTCTATDTAGRSASQVVEVVVMGAPHTEDLHLPAGAGGKADTVDVKPEAPMKKGDEVKVKPPVTPLPPPPVQVPAADHHAPPTPTAAPDHHETAAPAPTPAEAAKPPTPAESTHEMPKPAAPKPDEQGVATAPAPAETPAPAQSDVYKSSTEMESWIKELKQGKIEYKVPDKMLLLHAATVTVVIHGYQDVNTATLPQPTGTASLKQSPRMKVELLAEDNPDDFTIALENGDMVKDILSNGETPWIWKVTPNKSGAKQRIKILVSLMYPNADKSEIPLEDYHTTVEVDVASLWSTVVDDYQHDPMKFFSYMIPGGAGFTFIAGLVVWWWKRKHKDEKE